MSRDEKIEREQRAIAEKMGVPWEAYVSRANQGVQQRVTMGGWSPRWYLRFAWRPPAFPEFVEGSFPSVAANAEWADMIHNRAILAAIPKTEYVPPNDVLALAAREHGRVGR